MCPFGERSDLLFPVAGLIVFGSFVDILLSMFYQPIKQAGELSSHGCDGFGSSQTGAEPAVLRAQVTLAPNQGGGCVAERNGGPIDHLAGSAVQNLATALLVGGT